MDAVRVFTLKNKGAFIVHLQIAWSTRTAHGVYKPSGSLAAGAEQSVDLVDAAEIPQGADVRLKVVVAGSVKTPAASEQFTYSAKYGGSVVYAVKGTTFKPSLTMEQQDTKHIEFGIDSLYQCLHDGILSAFPALRQSKNTRFQFVATPMAAEWDETSFTTFYGLADVAPSEMGHFYLAGSSHVSQSYSNLLNSIVVGVGTNDPKYQMLEVQHKTALALYSQTVGEAKGAFLLAKQQGCTTAQTLDDWLETTEGKSYQQDLAQLSEQMQDYKDAMDAIKKQLREPLERAQAALKSDHMSCVDGTNSIVEVPKTVIGGNLLKDTARWQSLISNYRQGLKIGFDLSLNIVPSVQKSAHMSEGLKGCPANGIESKIDFERLILDEHYSLTLKLIGFNSYPVIRGTWYDDTFVSRDVKLYETSGFKISHFFGANGVLRLIPTTMVVAYHPILELTVSKSTYEAEVQQQLSDCPEGVPFCGFVLGGSKIPDIQEKESLVTLTLEAADTQPAQLIGVISIDKTV